LYASVERLQVHVRYQGQKLSTVRESHERSTKEYGWNLLERDEEQVSVEPLCLDVILDGHVLVGLKATEEEDVMRIRVLGGRNAQTV